VNANVHIIFVLRIAQSGQAVWQYGADVRWSKTRWKRTSLQSSLLVDYAVMLCQWQRNVKVITIARAASLELPQNS